MPKDCPECYDNPGKAAAYAREHGQDPGKAAAKARVRQMADTVKKKPPADTVRLKREMRVLQDRSAESGNRAQSLFNEAENQTDRSKYRELNRAGRISQLRTEADEDEWRAKGDTLKMMRRMKKP